MPTCCAYSASQFRCVCPVRSLVGEDAFPLPVASLLLEEAGEIHDGPRLLVGQPVQNLNQLAGNRAHIKKLIRHGHSGKHVVGITPPLLKAGVIAPSNSDSSQ